MVKIHRSRLKLKKTPREEFLGLDTPSRPDFPSHQPPPSGENFQFAICRGCVYFSWNNPIQHTYTCTDNNIMIFCSTSPYIHYSRYIIMLLMHYCKLIKIWLYHEEGSLGNENFLCSDDGEDTGEYSVFGEAAWLRTGRWAHSTAFLYNSNRGCCWKNEMQLNIFANRWFQNKLKFKSLVFCTSNSFEIIWTRIAFDVQQAHVNCILWVNAFNTSVHCA